MSYLRQATNAVGATRYEAQHPARFYVPAGATLQGHCGEDFIGVEVYLQGHFVSQQ